MLALLGVTGGAGGSRAQFAASAAFDTEYDFRGLTLDDGRPDIRINLSYDHPSGAYVGISGLAGDTVGNGMRPLGYLGYLGYAHQTLDGLTWDVGATNAGLTIYLTGRSEVASRSPLGGYRYQTDYAEVYGGVAMGDLSVHLYLSPNYLGQGVRTAYLDLDEGFRPTGWLRLYVHGGALTPLVASSPDAGADRERLDLGAGAVWTLPRAELRLGWSGISPAQDYPASFRQNQSKFVLSLQAFF